MLNVYVDDIVRHPFPHIAKDEILPIPIFEALKRDFPSGEIFSGQHAASGSVGSRVGAGGGFDIYRGDDAYDALIRSSSAWANFDAYINSQAFVSTFLEIFGDELAALGCDAEIDPAQYNRQHIEPRAVLTEEATISERARQLLPKMLRRIDRRPKLFTRLDIERSLRGYAKPPHCDRENRLCSLIIYFTNMEAEGIEGGELNIYRHKVKTDPVRHERHPRADDVEVVSSLTPRGNFGVFFPCSNNSYHGVNAVRTAGKARDFLYINISVASPSCWS